MIVYKFGGTSVGLPERMHKVAQIINKDSQKKIVVLSAVAGTTNTLVQIGENLQLKKISDAQEKVHYLKNHYRNYIDHLYSTDEKKAEAKVITDEIFETISYIIKDDFSVESEKKLLAQGEIISTNLFHLYLKEIGVSNLLINALDYMYINEAGEPDFEIIKGKLNSKLSSNPSVELFITQGFICKNTEGKIDNLKRGGSDYSASIIGAVTESSEVQIWTDIDGMHNNDPRIVRNTHPIAELSFDEAAELAYFGAKILHPSSILPAQQYQIPVRLKNTMNESAPGTLISKNSIKGSVKAIAAKDGITAIKIKSTRMLLAYGFLRKVFEIFEKYKTSIDMITTSEVAVTLTIDNQTHLQSIIAELEEFGYVEVDKDMTIICVVGNMVSETKGVVRKIFNSLSDIPIRMVSYGGSRYNISMLINSGYKHEALNNLNQGLFDN
ncbi:MAG: aspartate kinase [Cyclobacteriaceae bacterium]|nr:aspartate kinase [Cyclobacteriaceae bacterium]